MDIPKKKPKGLDRLLVECVDISKIPADTPLMTVKNVCQFLGCKRTFFYTKILVGGFPEPTVRLGYGRRRSPRWTFDQIKGWLTQMILVSALADDLVNGNGHLLPYISFLLSGSKKVRPSPQLGYAAKLLSQPVFEALKH